MTVLTLYVATFAVFLGLDYIALTNLIKPTFEKDIAPLLLDSPRMGPAVIFYAFYVGVLLWFVSWPAIQMDKSLIWVFASGAVIGAMAYGTYEFTNLATLKDWTWTMVATDFTWGTFLTGASATAGVAIARAFG